MSGSLSCQWGPSSIAAMPTEGSLYKLDSQTLEYLSKKSNDSYDRNDPNYQTVLNDVNTVTKNEDNCDQVILVFNRKGQLMFHQFWSLYEETFKNIVKEVWRSTPIGKKIYSIGLTTKCYTEINDTFNEVYFGIPFTLTWKIRQEKSYLR